uniref:hypothetical protein n=1 Tax=Staphylococcus epidermidis TaxID=1282 RepID=UPI001643070B
KIDGIILNIDANEKDDSSMKDIKGDREIGSWKEIGDYGYGEGNDGVFKEDELVYIVMMEGFGNRYVRKGERRLMLGGGGV